ncbi:MAG: NAD-dependent epimerase/dehydratase family protein [Bacteroidetes bacterium]|nr:NAD-dependent epimerase/dehydratase family protein [Bacteroidota bacterium]
MKILATGGAGFIASHVVDALIEKGHEIVVVDNLYCGFEKNINPKAKFHKLDIGDPEIQNLVAEFKPEVVIHHAAQMDVRKSVSDPMFDATTNVIGSLNLLEACRKNGVRKFMFSSTGGAIYGEQDYFPADEEHPLRPLSPYGITKLCLEKYLFYYKEVFGLEHVILRYGNIYGPRQNPHGEAGVIAIFIKKILAGEQPVINGPGTQTRDYTYVGDVVQANLLALDYKKSGIFNVGTGIETDVNRLFTVINQALGNPAKEIHAEAKAGEQQRSVLSTRKISEELGWAQKMSLEEGLKITVEWFKSHHQG